MQEVSVIIPNYNGISGGSALQPGAAGISEFRDDSGRQWII